MSADIVNLRQARKNKARQDKERQAEENRRVHGRTKAEKNITSFERSKSAKDHEGHFLRSVSSTIDPVSSTTDKDEDSQ
ncbi:DUF4169 family protein [Rhodobacteraceae bacterium RKSG542]|uniref:DUF4169 family protein n=1 Tax=Pseudovibrio flavus TaxID=2529854 RepID=UPI0012BC3990|nr:DUF4169 family protein [Pseudovibrio flavus]MTI19169.1 DUF4169 family protein [Pseudovibrio flavus]